MPQEIENNSIQDAETLTEKEKQLVSRFRDQIALELENYARIARIEDYKKCKSMEWHGFCLHAAKTVFADRSLLRAEVYNNGSCTITNCNAYNLRLLSAIYDLYMELCCTVPGLPCRVFDFRAFVGISKQAWYNLQERLTPASIDLTEKAREMQESSVAYAGEAGRINPTMSLAWLNHFHGWTQAREVIHRDGGQVLDGGSWAGRFIGENPNPCSIPEGERKQAAGLQLPETTQ